MFVSLVPQFRGVWQRVWRAATEHPGIVDTAAVDSPLSDDLFDKLRKAAADFAATVDDSLSPPPPGRVEDWAAWWAALQALRARLAKGEREGVVQLLFGRMDSRTKSVVVAHHRHRVQQLFMKKRVVTLTSSSIDGPRPGKGHGTAAQLAASADEVRGWFTPRGTPHPLFRRVLDRYESEGWPEDRWRHYVCNFDAQLPLQNGAPQRNQKVSIERHRSAPASCRLVPSPPAHNTAFTKRCTTADTAPMPPSPFRREGAEGNVARRTLRTLLAVPLKHQPNSVAELGWHRRETAVRSAAFVHLQRVRPRGAA
eukprot:SAG22_NODE_992_length_6129_cov_5.002488_3_plen_311_part_00